MKELHLDILCFLREQSKWNKEAQELFTRLMDKTEMYIKHTENK